MRFAGRKRWVVCIAAVVAVLAMPLAMVMCLVVIPSIKERLGRRSFDSAEWRTAPHDFDNTLRLRMVDDLLGRYSLQGMTRRQVTDLIGEPDDTAYFRTRDMVYRLGPERGSLSIDSEWLVLRLDYQQRVAERRIITD